MKNNKNDIPSPSAPQPDNGKPKKRRRRWPWITLGIILLLLISIRLALRADWVFDIIKDQVEQAAFEATGAELTIGSMRGDLLRSIELRNADLTKDEPILTIDSLEVSYSLLGLFSRNIEITSLRISGLDVQLEQLPDSTWNIMQLVDEPDPEAEETEFGFTLYLHDVELVNSKIDIFSPYLLPDDRVVIENINASASLTYSEDIFDANLSELSLELIEGRLPEPIRLQTSASMADERITLDRLMLSTGR